jgi:hypothetical protein
MEGLGFGLSVTQVDVVTQFARMPLKQAQSPRLWVEQTIVTWRDSMVEQGGERSFRANGKLQVPLVQVSDVHEWRTSVSRAKMA